VKVTLDTDPGRPFGFNAELRGTSLDEARAEPGRAGATFTPSANDGYRAAG
jgi:hypothetical protein